MTRGSCKHLNSAPHLVARFFVTQYLVATDDIASDDPLSLEHGRCAPVSATPSQNAVPKGVTHRTLPLFSKGSLHPLKGKASTQPSAHMVRNTISGCQTGAPKEHRARKARNEAERGGEARPTADSYNVELASTGPPTCGNRPESRHMCPSFAGIGLHP